MAHFNQSIIIGNLVKDIELKSVPSGKMVTQFTLAVQRDGTGDHVDYIPCVAWEKQAETLDKYAKKGRSILVVGRLEISKKGEGDAAKYYPQIVVSSVKFNDFKKNEET